MDCSDDDIGALDAPMRVCTHFDSGRFASNCRAGSRVKSAASRLQATPDSRPVLAVITACVSATIAHIAFLARRSVAKLLAT
ncbi:putative membrane protein [Xanthomonas euvesicatoria pv. vesicatoria str. 85-10]|uniref:Putative membrane protein n=1 Tax=Xanthomonas euvesicatoria pv. vesicatoria (strain 85-10) TaxID=316273 RepID=Q3BTF5_XANE5|nr:putative membrane protein [Xanthomonas euvesicatoria pv. vesicatoria str. 85-10]